MYKPVDRSFDESYVREQHQAMRWLVEQGLSPEEIRTFHWGNVVETEKVVRIAKPIFRLRYNGDTGELLQEEVMHEFKISLAGVECQKFFLKSRVWCHWAFLKERPQTWRREGSKDSLYSLSEVQKICGSSPQGQTETPLTNTLKFDTIRVSKLNITKTKSRGQGIEAEVVGT